MPPIGRRDDANSRDQIRRANPRSSGRSGRPAAASYAGYEHTTTLTQAKARPAWWSISAQMPGNIGPVWLTDLAVNRTLGAAFSAAARSSCRRRRRAGAASSRRSRSSCQGLTAAGGRDEGGARRAPNVRPWTRLTAWATRPAALMPADERENQTGRSRTRPARHRPPPARPRRPRRWIWRTRAFVPDRTVPGLRPRIIRHPVRSLFSPRRETPAHAGAAPAHRAQPSQPPGPRRRSRPRRYSPARTARGRRGGGSQLQPLSRSLGGIPGAVLAGEHDRRAGTPTKPGSCRDVEGRYPTLDPTSWPR